MRFSALSLSVAMFLPSLPALAFQGERIASEQEYQAYLNRVLIDGISIYFECQMGSLDCEEIAREFFQTHGSLYKRASRKEDAQLWARITDQSLPNGTTEVRFVWKAREEMDMADVAPPAYVVDFRSTPENVAINQVATQMAAHASFFLRATSAETSGTTTTVVFETKQSAVTKKAYTGPLFFDLSLSGSGSSNSTNSSFYGNGMASGTYSVEKFKVTAGFYLGQEKSSTTTDEGKLNGRNVAYDMIVRGVYSIHKRWSVALYGYANRNPGNNVQHMRDVISGVEWLLVPFRRTELKQAHVRAGVGIADVALGQENDLGWKNKTYFFTFANGGIEWPVANNKLTIGLHGSAYYYPEFKGYERFSAKSEATYQVTPQIRLQGSYGLEYRKRSLTFPGNPDYSNPLQTMFLRGVPGFASNFSVGIGVTLGNSRRQEADRRWRED